MPLSTLEIGLMVSVLLSAIALAAALKSLALARQQEAQNEKLFQQLAREVSSTASGSVGMGHRLLSMEKRLQTTPQTSLHISSLDSSGIYAHNNALSTQKIDYYNDEEFQSYSQAAQLLKLGLDSEEVARRCGLSRAEASLIQMMQMKVSNVG